MATYTELQTKNVRSSLMISAVVAALAVAMGWFAGQMFFPGNAHAPFIGLTIAGVLVLIQTLVAWFGGADLVLRMHRAHEVDASNGEYRQLYNIVDEMRIAAGIPMPRVYVIEDASPNAFATGRNWEDGRVAVTTGLMQMLNREELQGVVAHELAHIKNRDILFGTVVGIMVGMIAIIADITLRSLFWGGMGRSSGGDRGGQGKVVILIVGIALAILAPIAAQLLRMAVSRQREYLADASGAQFTRNPGGLASALQKISGTPGDLRSANRGTEHMFIVPPMANARARLNAGELFSTHPPTAKRIERLMGVGKSFER